MFNHYQLMRWASTLAYIDDDIEYFDEHLYGKRYKQLYKIDGNHGVFSMLIEDETDKTHALVFRGSDVSGWRFVLNWLETNVPNMVGGSINALISEQAFIESQKIFNALSLGKAFKRKKVTYNEMNQPIHITHVTGNSLGGTHAFLIGAYHPEVEVVTMNPGPMISKWVHKKNLNQSYPNITNYITNSDPLFKGITLVKRENDILGQKLLIKQSPLYKNDLLYHHWGEDADLVCYRYLDHNRVVKAELLDDYQIDYYYDELELIQTEKIDQMLAITSIMIEECQHRLEQTKHLQEELIMSIKHWLEVIVGRVLRVSKPQLDASIHYCRERLDSLFNDYTHHYDQMIQLLDARKQGLASIFGEEQMEEKTFNHEHLLLNQKQVELIIYELLEKALFLYIGSAKQPLRIIEMLISKQKNTLLEKANDILFDITLYQDIQQMIALHNQSLYYLLIVLKQQNRNYDTRLIQSIRKMV